MKVARWLRAALCAASRTTDQRPTTNGESAAWIRIFVRRRRRRRRHRRRRRRRRCAAAIAVIDLYNATCTLWDGEQRPMNVR